MTEPRKFNVGDTVMMSRMYSKPKSAVVTKLGRKYAYAAAGRDEMQVDILTGQASTGSGRIWTMQEWNDRVRLEELRAELRAHNIGPVGGSQFKQPVETLEALVEVLRRANPIDPGVQR
ncbi:hypothetical protein [Microbacterium sp. NPDC080220]|uniref:beta barrel domain-containing protein n=1 Tax=Microbacterium sp. NPDC080220 TaxID=3161017 RepID=UPI00342375D5